MNLNEVKTLLAGTIKTAFKNKKTLDRFEDTTGTLKYNGVPVNNAPVFVADDSPVGNIISFMGNSAPQDYLICDGAEYQIADYPLLVQHFINEFGSANYFGGDGEATFAVPDLRGEFLRGTGTATRDTGTGANVGEHQEGTINPNIWMYRASTNATQGKLIAEVNPDINSNVFSNADYEYISSTDRQALSPTSAISILTYAGTQKTYGYTSRPTNTSVLYCIKYQITQNNISKDMVNYSLEEQVIGSWIDGKPLYQKTINYGALPNKTSKSIPSGIENLDYIISMYGTALSSSYKAIKLLPFVHSSDIKYNIQMDYRNNGVFITSSNDFSAYDISYITIQYTKTTDAENSFTPDMLSNISSFNTTVTDEDVNDVIGGM